MPVSLDMFDKCCRCCLSTNGPLQALFGASLADMLSQVTSIEVQENDNYPQQICVWCIRKLSSSYNFQRMVLKNHEMFTEVLEVKNEPVESRCEEVCEIKVKPDGDQMGDDNENIKGPDENTEKINLNDVEKAKIQSPFIFEEFKEEDSNSCEDDKPLKENSASSVENKSQVPKKLKCRHCMTYFDDIHELKSHVKSHRGECKTCGATVGLSSLARHMRTHDLNTTDSPYSCNVCGRLFNELIHLTRHIRIHRMAKQRLKRERQNLEKCLCSYCGKRFKWYTSLLKHMRYHTGNNLHTCPFCDHKYSDSYYLKIHIQNHVSPGSFVCEECGRKFCQKSAVNRHKQRAHGSATLKPYQCDLCSKRFCNKYTLKAHLKRKHTTEPLVFTCSQCGKQFLDAQSFKGHLKYHELAAEESADKREREIQKIEVGKKAIEVGVKDPKKINIINVEYLCLECSTKFRRKQDLLVHNCHKKREE